MIKLLLELLGHLGVGCTTIAEAIQEKYGFQFYSLSDTLREEWSNSEKASEKPVDEALRDELQEFGNELLQESLSILA